MDAPTILEGIFVLAAFSVAIGLVWVAQQVRDAGRRFREFEATLDEDLE